MIIAFTVNNRPDYLRQTLESWSKVRGIGDWVLIFACEPGCPESVEVCKSVDFASAVIATSQRRQGVLRNPWLALDHAFGVAPDLHGPHDFAVLAEEDLIVSPDVLEYFTWCQRYADDPSVLGVTTYQHHEQTDGLQGVGPADWSRDDQWHFWVWGTWRDRWQSLLRDSWDTAYEENGGGPNQRGFDWKIRNTLVVGQGMHMIAPSLSRSQHIGKFGGTHCTPDQFESLLSPSFAGLDVPPQNYHEVNYLPVE